MLTLRSETLDIPGKKLRSNYSQYISHIQTGWSSTMPRARQAASYQGHLITVSFQTYTLTAVPNNLSFASPKNHESCSDSCKQLPLPWRVSALWVPQQSWRHEQYHWCQEEGVQSPTCKDANLISSKVGATLILNGLLDNTEKVGSDK